MKNETHIPDESTKPKRHFMHFVLDADKNNNPMPPNEADSILKRILSFFFSYIDNKKER